MVSPLTIARSSHRQGRARSEGTWIARRAGFASGGLDVIDRLAPRRRPPGFPVLHQRWHGLVFLHWAFASEALRALVPAGLELDLYDGRAWVGITPFTVSHMRPSLVPPLPGVSSADEINVRVYVHRDGVPGIWFPSLEITNRLALVGARIAYRLAYFHARMRVDRHGDDVSFRSERSGDPDAVFDAQWRLGPPRASAEPGSLEFFLIERYVLYSGERTMLRARIHHRPWPLRDVTVLRLASTLLEADGLPSPPTSVLAHAQAEPFDVEIWPPRRV
jgi:uncharacterized protein YqjF (DUF2071 family)